MDRATAAAIVGPIGVWSFLLEQAPAARAREAVAEIEALGYGSVWIPEARGKEAFTHAALLLTAGRRIAVATGIANVWARDPMATAAGMKTLAEAFPNRFVLGLGVSFAGLVQTLRGHDFTRPLEYMRTYLDAMARAPYQAAAPSVLPPIVLAALGPKMLALAAEKTTGAHPYFVPVEHTARARAILGAGKLLATEVAVVLERAPSTAREIARRHTAYYVEIEHHRRNLRSLGWTDADFEGAGSDRLVDAIVAWGDEEAIAKRVAAHREAGADHVCLQVLRGSPEDLALPQLRRLAGALALD